LQWLKNIVPLPKVPETGGSSPWWPRKLKILGSKPVLQNPVFPSRRLTRQRRGQIWQEIKEAKRLSDIFFSSLLA
jgi:hypothetical protein